jgi:hypothetical protein
MELSHIIQAPVSYVAGKLCASHRMGGGQIFVKFSATTAYRKACRIISLSSPVKFCRPIPCKAKVSWGEGEDLTVPIEMRYSVDFLWNKRLGEYNRKKEERGKVNSRS